jgi:hypothetical protein
VKDDAEWLVGPAMPRVKDLYLGENGLPVKIIIDIILDLFK